MELLLADLKENSEKYQQLQNRVLSTIQGRCCHHHVKILQSIIAKLGPIYTYLEIGVHNGTSMSYIVSQTVNPVLCIGIDLFEGTITRYAHDKLQQARTESNIRLLNDSQSQILLIKGDSRAESTRNAVITALNSRPLDLLFIDGDHTFEGVESDFLLYAPLVRSGGYIVFDDANSTYPGILQCIDKHIKGSPTYKILGCYENTDLVVKKL